MTKGQQRWQPVVRHFTEHGMTCRVEETGGLGVEVVVGDGQRDWARVRALTPALFWPRWQAWLAEHDRPEVTPAAEVA